MKTKIYFLLIVFASCKTPSVQHGLHGLYYAKGNDFEYSLTLNRDSTFLLKLKYQDAVPECSGKWKYLTKDTLGLSCSVLNNIAESLTNGFMTERNRKVKIINQNKLKLGEVLLKKTK